MLLTRMRFKLPISAASKDWSNAFNDVGPSAAPATRVNFFGVGSIACDLLQAKFTVASIPEGGRSAMQFRHSEPKNLAISAMAVSGLSDACTMLYGNSTAKS